VQQRDQGAEQRAAGDEGAGAVDRVEQPDPFGIGPVGAVFLAPDAVAGEALAQQGADGAFGAAVGLGDGAGIALGVNQQGRTEKGADDRPRRLGGRLGRRDVVRPDQGFGAPGVMLRR
jgi:hypothetical protein